MAKPNHILFLDLEVHPKRRIISEIGALLDGDQYRGRDLEAFLRFSGPATVVCGHNIIDHDLSVLREAGLNGGLEKLPAVDTLFLSALLFPKKPYHHLVKDYQLQGTEIANPVADARLARELLGDIVRAYHELPEDLKTVYVSLLRDIPGFDGLFRIAGPNVNDHWLDRAGLTSHLRRHYSGLFCGKTDLPELIYRHPVELAYALALITTGDPDSLPPPWLLHRFPAVQQVINRLRIRCDGLGGCSYCQHLSPREGLRRYFGFREFRRFENDGEKPLQEAVVEAALAGRSLLAIFPTGGGKSLTFQLPALIKGAANHSLTVIISPLQSLMKDQVDVLRQRHDITTAVAISGLLSPLERSEALERVREGGANLLYIAPESLRSTTIFNILKGRQINRFVVDEAHCFSSWGQDFRVDYLYIGAFLRKLQREKNLAEPIPVSCFTATAKPAVVEDIRHYFYRELDLELEVFQTSSRRENLRYFVIKTDGPEEKFHRLTELLHSEEGPKIVYVSRVKSSEQLAFKLRQYGFNARAYNGQMDRDEKVRIQNEFMDPDSDLDIIVATSAFGMGVDKDDVKMVVHFTISDSLENYIQESGRAGRRADVEAKCFVLFDENDLNEHFSLLNSTRLSHKEVYQIWQGIKRFKKRTFTKSALEIARQAGWDTEIYQLETRVRAAIAALEDSGYLRREENAPRIFAQSILVKNMDEANEKLEARKTLFSGDQELQDARRVFSALITSARTGGDTRVDVMADNLGLEQHVVMHILNMFRQAGLLSNEKDLTLYYYTVQGERNSAELFKKISSIEKNLFELLFPEDHHVEKKIFLRELNETINGKDIPCTPLILKNILNYWSITNAVRKERIDRTNEQYRIRRRLPVEQFRQQIDQRAKAGSFCLEVFRIFYLPHARKDNDFNDKKLLELSVLDLKERIEQYARQQFPVSFYEHLLLYLHHLEVIELKSGLLIYYNPMRIIREEKNNNKRYRQEDYEKLDNYYQSRTEQIHIVGEYARRQLQYSEEAIDFVEDYFTLPYQEFLARYFKNRKKEISQPITEEKFRQLFSSLSAEQLQVVKDNRSNNILVAAGPGSGKTRVLVHKVASLLLLEDVKPEQFLMLTFSRPAAREVKTRLRKLVGKVAYFVDIFTYHGFAFRLAGRMGDLERSRNILPEMTKAIQREEVGMERLRNKSVIVIDEYQDVSEEEYRFITAIINKAEKIRVIVAGDDDQNIYEFRGASIKYMQDFQQTRGARTYFLTSNYRACSNLVDFTNRFLETRLSADRIKNEAPLVAYRKEEGAIELTRYRGRHLILPLVENIRNKELKGSTAVLTHTNEEAALVALLLQEAGIPARLMEDREGFSIGDLLEIRFFSHAVLKSIKDELGVITEDCWKAAKDDLERLFAGSVNLDLARRMIADYESTHPKKFRSTWNSFLQECRLEDFFHPESETILLSTMHKSKGKEFDNVFLLLNHYPLETEEKKRVLYVAMTRARDQLFIHTNNVAFATEGIANLQIAEENRDWPEPDTVVLQCNLSDVWLGYFKNPWVVAEVKDLQAGEPLIPETERPAVFRNGAGREVLWLSKPFEKRLLKYLEKGYDIYDALVRFIVVWYDEESGNSYRVVLPKLVMKKEKTENQATV